MTAATMPPPAVPQWLSDAVAGLVMRAYEAGWAQALATMPPAPSAPPGPTVPVHDTLTRREGARFIRCGLTKFDLLARRGEFHTFKVEGVVLVYRADLQAWLDKHAQGRAG